MVDENGFILCVRKNALQVLIPKYGLEGTLWLKSDKPDCPEFQFFEEVYLICQYQFFKKMNTHLQ